ncbi:uncharacterized protein LOC133306089 [Gastrolobium bilobum]|uniref:uncharacterized protein LOC133306089 n=1 Tax=Gastrolobium bilobum TaxID=150636 RepID=UPI002AAFCEC0|nr:uncharacterized protein LOC133306089 [Gastrolobium bilobum]
MAVDIAAATFGTKSSYYNKKNKHLLPLAFYPKAYYLIIRFPNSIWNIFYRLMILAFIISSFTLISSSLVATNSNDSTTSTIPQQQQQQSMPHEDMDHLLTLLFRDLTNEGLMSKTQHNKAVFLSNNVNDMNINGEGFQVVTDYNMDHISLNDLEKQSTILDDTVDFVFTSNFPAASEFIERTLKNGGVVTVLLNDNPSASFYKPSNFKISYMRRFDLIAMAMKKTGETKLGSQRKLCGYATEAKKAALKNLEDVLLEPPRAASGKSRVYLKRTKYLPDLMGDSLESYPRRVFIDAGLPEKDGGSGTDWFPKNYPTRNKNFEIYKIETVGEGSSEQQTEMSDWLRKNVKEEEYVVMKGEAEVVEEMMRSKAITLVDELFLECKPQGLKKGNMRNRRAYWECLALYGKLRDEGVAVHQWWG